MPLPINSRLGPYEIKSPLGAGGMGEVYRARDSRLNRDVAIKILRTDGVAGPELRGRFEREARAVAALNHPNIVAVYDFGIEASQQYIVSELIDGESLRSLMRGKSVAARRLVDLATQIADGLAAAHTAGIVHRDLKPENIMIAKDGRVKILDFGLARQARPSGIFAAGDQDETVAATPEDRNITGEGAVIGTPNYMSPEQAVGRELDYRSDQFSFGLILYELASGKRAFAKTSTVETMAAIVREEPAPMDDKLPPPLRWIIDRCLAKEPEQRYESTRDLYRDLKNLRDHFSEAYSSGTFPRVEAAPSRRNYKKFAAICLGCIALGALVVYVLKPSGQNIGDLQYTPFASNARRGFWSPDGKSVAYTGYVKGVNQTFIKFLNSPTPVQLTHELNGARALGWSGGGSHILVAQAIAIDRPMGENRILSFAAVGGEPDFIMNADCFVCALSPDGKVLADATVDDQGIFHVMISDPIGSPFVPYKPAPFSSRNDGTPELSFSPNGKSILLIESDSQKRQAAWLLPYPAGSNTPRLVLPNLAIHQISPSTGWLPDNRHIVISLEGSPNAPRHLWIEDTQSDQIYPLTNGIADERYPALSPDGKNLVFTNLTTSMDIVSLSVEDGAVATLVSTGHREGMASWAATRDELVWVSDRGGYSEIWLRSSDGSDRPIISALDFSGELLSAPSLSPTGDRIIFAKSDTSGKDTLWIASLSGGSAIRLTQSELGEEFNGAWSPDGSRFAYVSFGNGKYSLATVKTGGGATPVMLRENCGGIPMWSPSGEWITCEDDDQGWMLVSPNSKATKVLGKINTPQLVFSKDGKLVYGISTSASKAGQASVFFSLDLATLNQKVIKPLDPQFQPGSDYGYDQVFSMAPDGKSFVYATAKHGRDLWMLKGFKQPGWLDRFSLH